MTPTRKQPRRSPRDTLMINYDREAPTPSLNNATPSFLECSNEFSNEFSNDYKLSYQQEYQYSGNTWQNIKKATTNLLNEIKDVLKNRFEISNDTTTANSHNYRRGLLVLKELLIELSTQFVNNNPVIFNK